MREIKFRAWSKDASYMKYDAAYIEHGIFLIDTDGPFWDWMQWCGLQDKNACDIYEGDIMHSKSCLAAYDTRIVEFSNGQFMTRIYTATQQDSLWGTACASSYWEVIGNIYENPELLKDKV